MHLFTSPFLPRSLCLTQQSLVVVKQIYCIDNVLTYSSICYVWPYPSYVLRPTNILYRDHERTTRMASLLSTPGAVLMFTVDQHNILV